jgi:hypothetical protein
MFPQPKMKTCLKVITNICLLLVLVTGCQDQASTKSSPQTEMSGRLDAALAMEKGTSRHNALSRCATDAAEAGEVDIVLKAIAAIGAGTARDNLCSVCSEVLAKQGKASEATKVAKQIANDTARNNMLGRIASSAIK